MLKYSEFPDGRVIAILRENGVNVRKTFSSKEEMFKFVKEHLAQLESN